MGQNLKLKVIDISHHRNGVRGAPFYVVIFDDKAVGRMVASLFEEEGYCAVYKIDELVKGNIRFGMGNSWRGDRYEEVLRPLVNKWEEKRSESY